MKTNEKTSLNSIQQCKIDQFLSTENNSTSNTAVSAQYVFIKQSSLKNNSTS